MSSGIDDLLDMIDGWKFALHDKLEGMTATERRAFWKQIHEQARKKGLHVAEPERPPRRTTKRVRRTG
jgi:hypothetical protein